MKMNFVFLVFMLSMIGCNNSFNTNLPQFGTPTIPTNPGTTSPVNSSKYFYYQYGELGYVDETTLATTPIHKNSNGSLAHIDTDLRRPTDIKNYFIDYYDKKIYLFNSDTHAFTEIVSDASNLSLIASGNSLLTYDNSFTYFVHPSLGASLSANIYYGLNGTTNSINGSKCRSLGRDYFLCINSGTNSDKAVLLKKDSQGNPSSKTFPVSTTYPSLELITFTKKLGIIVFYDSSDVPMKYYAFNYAQETLTEIAIPTVTHYSEFFPSEDSYSIKVRSYSGDDFKFYLMNGETGSLSNPLTSSVPFNTPGSLFNYHWYVYDVSADKTKHYITGYSSITSKMAVIEMTSNSSTIHDLDLTNNDRFMFINDKFYTTVAGELRSVDITNAGALEPGMTLHNSIRSAYCSSKNEASNCPMNITNIWWSGIENIDGYKYFRASLELNGSSDYVNLGLKNSAPLIFKSSSEPGFDYYFGFERIRKEGIAIFNNYNAQP